MKIFNNIVPKNNKNNLIVNNVGISFCTKTNILKEYKFIASDTEDEEEAEKPKDKYLTGTCFLKIKK